MIKNKTENLLPKILRGTVHAQYVRCGKSNCKCARGELHGPYFYFFFRKSGKLRKHYLKSSEIEQIQTACNERRNRQRERQAQLKYYQEVFRDYRSGLREIEKYTGMKFKRRKSI